MADNTSSDNKPKWLPLIGEIQPAPERSISIIPHADGEHVYLSFLRDHNKTFYIFGKNVIFHLPTTADEDLIRANGITPRPETTGQGASPYGDLYRGDYHLNKKDRKKMYGVPNLIGVHGFRFTIVNEYLTGGVDERITVQEKSTGITAAKLQGMVVDYSGSHKSCSLADSKRVFMYGGTLTDGFTTHMDRFTFEYVHPRQGGDYWRWWGDCVNNRAVTFGTTLVGLQ